MTLEGLYTCITNLSGFLLTSHSPIVLSALQMTKDGTPARHQALQYCYSRYTSNILHVNLTIDLGCSCKRAGFGLKALQLIQEKALH